MDEKKQHSVDDEENKPQRRGRPITREAIERLRQIREEIMKDRNGKLFEDSAEMIRQMREERTKQLMQAVTGQYDDEEENTTTEQFVPDEANVSQQRRIPDDFLEQVHRIREQVIQDSKGELFEDSTELIRQEREKRTKQIMQAATDQFDEEEEDTPEEQAVPEEANKAPRQWRPVTSKTFERLRRIREEIMEDRKGELFEDSAEILRREREKRTEYLMQVFTGQYDKDPYDESTPEEQS